MELNSCGVSSADEEVCFSTVSSSFFAEFASVIYFGMWPRRKTKTSAVENVDEFNSVAIR